HPDFPAEQGELGRKIASRPQPPSITVREQILTSLGSSIPTGSQGKSDDFRTLEIGHRSRRKMHTEAPDRCSMITPERDIKMARVGVPEAPGRLPRPRAILFDW